MYVVGLVVMSDNKPDLSHLVDLTLQEVEDCISFWRDKACRYGWDTDDELTYVLVTSLVRKHFKEQSE